jgi:tetratricopeptide (TPR) repeat protein
MDTQQYHEAMDSYLNAIRRAYDLPCYWNSIGALYFVDGQFVNSIKALAIALNSNPYVPEFWYNLGVLVSFSKFFKTRIIAKAAISMSSPSNLMTLFRHMNVVFTIVKHAIQLLASDWNTYDR